MDKDENGSKTATAPASLTLMREDCTVLNDFTALGF